MEKVPNLLLKLSRQLFSDSAQQEKFVDALVHPQPFPGCILWCQPKPEGVDLSLELPLPWQPDFIDRLTPGQRPGQHPLHQQGYFYCLDFSSVFAISTLMTIAAPVSFILDVCASPGGKSLFAWRTLQPGQLLSNEVIGKRTAALIANLKRCQIRPAAVSSLDSKILAQVLPQTAEVVLVDAPCSGQSLIAKGDKAVGCFHPVNINKNANRQKRILANSASTVAPGGYLAYTTCTYAEEENEQVCRWFLQRFPQFRPLEIPHLRDYQSHLTELPCYRMWPYEGLGAGAFTMLLQNQEAGDRTPLPPDFFNRPGLTIL